MNFETQVQQWVLLDNQLKILYEKIRELREKRDTIEELVTAHMSKQSANSPVKISDGQLKLVNTRVPESLTFKYLEKSLSEIIKNESQRNVIMKHIKQNRNVKYISELKRVYDN
jgi:hypothetical protein